MLMKIVVLQSQIKPITMPAPRSQPPAFQDQVKMKMAAWGDRIALQVSTPMMYLALFSWPASSSCCWLSHCCSKRSCCRISASRSSPSLVCALSFSSSIISCLMTPRSSSMTSLIRPRTSAFMPDRSVLTADSAAKIANVLLASSMTKIAQQQYRRTEQIKDDIDLLKMR